MANERAPHTQYMTIDAVLLSQTPGCWWRSNNTAVYIRNQLACECAFHLARDKHWVPEFVLESLVLIDAMPGPSR